MPRYFMLFSVFFLFTQGTYAATKLDAKAFITSIQGEYFIHATNGAGVEPDNSIADVYADVDVAVFTMPYCIKLGFCDPGYTYFPYAKTTAVEETLADGSIEVTLEVNDGAVRKYVWTKLAKPVAPRFAEITFYNPNYKVSGVLTPLTHELTKQNTEPLSN